MEISKNFYEKNAELFSDTRFCLWDVVKNFSENFQKTDIVCDAGCGNGKNMKYLIDKCQIIGFDKSENLINICKRKGYSVLQSDILNISYDSNKFNYILCIAVIHHLDSEEKHLKAINELIRILKDGGKLLITLWAYESDIYSKSKNFQKGHNIINFREHERYYYIYDDLMLKNMLSKIKYDYKYWWERGNWNIIITK